MKTTILSLFACCTLMMSAQEVTISKKVPLLKGVETAAYFPVLNEDGTKMVYTGENQKGLKLYDFKDDVSVAITNADKAGMYPTFSSDGKIYFVTQNMKNNLNYRSVESYEIASKKSNMVLKDQRRVTHPQALKGGVVVKTAKGVEKTTNSKEVYVYTDKSRVVVGQNGRERSFTPVESYAGYLWASLSPDKEKVMFYAAGKGIVIMNLDGEILSQPGNYVHPVWMGNDYIVVQNSKDDGHQYSSSQILLVKADGSFVKELTAPTSMTMHPSASEKAGRIVFDTIDGKLYMMELSIKE